MQRRQQQQLTNVEWLVALAFQLAIAIALVIRTMNAEYVMVLAF